MYLLSELLAEVCALVVLLPIQEQDLDQDTEEDVNLWDDLLDLLLCAVPHWALSVNIHLR